MNGPLKSFIRFNVKNGTEIIKKNFVNLLLNKNARKMDKTMHNALLSRPDLNKTNALVCWKLHTKSVWSEVCIRI